MSNAVNNNERHNHERNHASEPPAMLVDTWVWMMNKSREPELQAVGRDRLMDTFGDLSAAQQYHRGHSCR